MKIFRFFFTIALCMICTSIFANAQPKYYHKWMNVSSKELVSMGNDYINFKNSADSALVCFTIVTNRYKKDLGEEEKKFCCDAYVGKWFVYFLYYFDYQQSYYNLLKAEAIRDELQIEYPQIDLNIGCFYNTLSEQCDDKTLGDNAVLYLKKAFESGFRTNNKHVCDIAFSNLLGTMYETKNIKSLTGEWERYVTMSSEENDYIHKYNSILYNTLNLLEQNSYDKALVFADSLIALENDSNSQVRYTYMAYAIKSEICVKKGSYTGALANMKKAEQVALSKNVTDARLAVYKTLSEYYTVLKDKDNTEKYTKKYYMLKDTLLNYRQLTSISEMSFLNEIEKMDVEIKDIRQKKEIQNVILFLTVLLLVIIAVFSVILFLKNKQMNKSNKNLFINYQKLTKTEEEARQKLEEYMQEIKTLRENEGEDKEKYQSSNLQTDEKEEILYKILGVMNNVEEICSSTFSSERLAELTDTNYRYVSQVINEKYGCNFNALLNEYRIKEACRRLSNSDKYGCYTTEAISESVGFKSRTTFINSFKKVTGLTPSQYQKIARNENEESKKQ